MWKLLGESKVIGLGGSALEIDEGEDMGEIGGGTSTSMILVFSITGFEVLVSTISSKVSVSLLTCAFRGDSLIAGWAETLAKEGFEEADKGGVFSGQELLFFSRNFCLLRKSLLWSLDDFFFDFLALLEIPSGALDEEEFSKAKSNLEFPRLILRFARPVLFSVMSLARSKHFSRMRGGKNGVKELDISSY